MNRSRSRLAAFARRNRWSLLVVGVYLLVAVPSAILFESGHVEYSISSLVWYFLNLPAILILFELLRPHIDFLTRSIVGVVAIHLFVLTLNSAIYFGVAHLLSRCVGRLRMYFTSKGRKSLAGTDDRPADRTDA